MGRIIFCKPETHHFTLQSLTPFPVSFDVQAFVLEETELVIEPMSFSDIFEDAQLWVRVAFSTAPRKDELLGDVEYAIPILLEQNLAIVLHLQTFLAMPILNFSRWHCDIGNVIVRQCKVMTIKLQNINHVSREFRFGEAQFANVLQRGMLPDASLVYAASPASGLLSLSAFQNLEIAFAPLVEKCYSIQFLFTGKQTTQMTVITLRGSDVQLRMRFDPQSSHTRP
jgi:hypothetical protein